MDNKEIKKNINELYNNYLKDEEIITSFLSSFYDDANNLESLSGGKYKPEKSISLNKISIKGFILESEIVKQITATYGSDLKLSQIKQYLNSNNNIENESIIVAIKLYDLLEQIEKAEENEMYNIKYYIQLITNKIFDDTKEEVNSLYSNLQLIVNEYLKSNIISEEENKKFMYCLNILFNYYINGSRNISEV